MGFYSQICVRADTWGDKIDLPYAEYAQKVLKAVHAKIIVLIGTEDLGIKAKGIKAKYFVKFSRPPSLYDDDAGGDQRKLTQLWETWFKGEWGKVLPLIKKYCDNEQNRREFLQPKRKAEGELEGPETKTSKAEKPLKCVEELPDFTRRE